MDRNSKLTYVIAFVLIQAVTIGITFIMLYSFPVNYKGKSIEY